MTLEIPAEGCWGSDCNISQVYDQATQDILRLLQCEAPRRGWKLIGEPKVVAIMVEEIR